MSAPATRRLVSSTPWNETTKGQRPSAETTFRPTRTYTTLREVTPARRASSRKTTRRTRVVIASTAAGSLLGDALGQRSGFWLARGKR